MKTQAQNQYKDHVYRNDQFIHIPKSCLNDTELAKAARLDTNYYNLARKGLLNRPNTRTRCKN